MAPDFDFPEGESLAKLMPFPELQQLIADFQHHQWAWGHAKKKSFEYRRAEAAQRQDAEKYEAEVKQAEQAMIALRQKLAEMMATPAPEVPVETPDPGDQVGREG